VREPLEECIVFGRWEAKGKFPLEGDEPGQTKSKGEKHCLYSEKIVKKE
jgi:hypothetical protein